MTRPPVSLLLIFFFAKPLVARQADILSGQIGLEADKLKMLERKLNAVSSKSSTGKKLMEEVRAQTLLIQNEASRYRELISFFECRSVQTQKQYNPQLLILSRPAPMSLKTRLKVSESMNWEKPM